MTAARPMQAPPDVLTRICDDTRAEVARRRAAVSAGALRDRIAAAGATRGFAAALRHCGGCGRLGLIAEIKQASPSGGLIRGAFDSAGLAGAYARGGAACLSVLTDWPHFQGTPADLQAARAAVRLPVLRKDFIVDDWQIGESRAIGADCILLIMAILSDAQAGAFAAEAQALGMDVLVEVHDAAELSRAVSLGSPLLGINNRDLRTLRTDLRVSERLAQMAPPGALVIAESGIATAADVRRMRQAGVHGLLVGESLLRQPDVEAATQALMEGQ